MIYVSGDQTFFAVNSALLTLPRFPQSYISCLDNLDFLPQGSSTFGSYSFDFNGTLFVPEPSEYSLLEAPPKRIVGVLFSPYERIDFRSKVLPDENPVYSSTSEITIKGFSIWNDSGDDTGFMVREIKTVAGAYCKLEMFAEALQLLSLLDVKKWDVEEYNTAADALCGLGKCQEARKLLDSFSDWDIGTYTVLAKIFVRIGKYQDALETLNPLKDIWDVYSYNIAAKALNKLEMYEKTLELLGELPKRDYVRGSRYEWNADTYATAGKSLNKMERPGIAFHLLNTLDRKKWNLHVYTTAGTALNKLKRYTRTIETLEEVPQREWDVPFCNVLAKALGRTGDPAAGLKLLYDLGTEQWDVHTVTVVDDLREILRVQQARKPVEVPVSEVVEDDDNDDGDDDDEPVSRAVLIKRPDAVDSKVEMKKMDPREMLAGIESLLLNPNKKNFVGLFKTLIENLLQFNAEELARAMEMDRIKKMLEDISGLKGNLPKRQIKLIGEELIGKARAKLIEVIRKNV